MATGEKTTAGMVGVNVLACWDFRSQTPADTLSDGERVEDACNDHDARVLDGLDVIDGISPGDGALTFNSSTPDALVFEPGYDFGDSGPVAGPEFDFESGDAITLEALVRVPPSFSGAGSIVSKDVGPGQASWWFRVNGGVLQGFVGDGTLQQAVTGDRMINDGHWHHVALVRQAGDSLSLYVDYELDAVEAIPAQDDITTPAGTPIVIGAFNNGTRELQGGIQMVRIARAALSPGDFLLYDEVANISVSIDSDGQPSTPGGTIEYLITVSNAGPMDTSGVEVEALMPVGVSDTTWTCTAAGGASCTASGSGDLIDLIDLPAGQSVSFTLSAELGSNPPPLLTYTTSIEPGAETDLGSDDNTASVTNRQTRVYVDHSADPGGNGMTWATAFRHLQDALAAAETLAEEVTVEIWVTAGVYYPDEGVGVTPNSRLSGFELVNNVAIYGGFAGTETSLDERDWLANPTILSGDIDGNDTVNADGITEHWQDIVGNNSYHVVRGKFLTSAVLDGFIVTGGRADGGNVIETYFLMRYGGGVHLYDSDIALNHLRVQGNLARHNTYPAYGGGVYSDSTESDVLRLNEVTIENNLGGYGGGLSADRCKIIGNRVNFLGNEAVTRGGALNVYLASFEFRNSEFSGNSSTNGGAIYSYTLWAALASSLVTGNHASENGGAVFFIDPSGPGGALVLTNVTMSGNRAGNEGGAVYRSRAQIDGGYTEARNSIIWSNQDSTGVGTASSTQAGNVADRLTASHSLLQGVNPGGESNFDGTDPANAPGFLTPLDPANAPSSAGNFHLPSDSPLIDSGDNQARINPNPNGWNPYTPIPIAGNIDFDLDGGPRILDGDEDGLVVIDLGPYESLGALGRSIGGQVSGLAGTGLVLQNNEDDPLSITANGNFTFLGTLADNATYDVSVLTQPGSPLQTCTVSNGTGTIDGQDVTDIEVDCVTETFSISGMVSGLTGPGLVLQNNGGDDLTIGSDGPFEFDTPLADEAPYEITVWSQPIDPVQSCSVSNGEGVIDGANVTDILVECIDRTDMIFSDSYEN